MWSYKRDEIQNSDKFKIILCDLIKEMKFKIVTNSKWWHFQVKKEVSCGVLAIILYIQEKEKKIKK